MDTAYLDMALPSRDQRHQYLRYEGLQYIDADIADFETRLARIYMREINRVQVFDFGGLLDLMAEGLSARMLMEHRDAQGQKAILDLDTPGSLQFQLGGVRRRMSWRESLFWLWDYIQQKRCRQLYVAGLAEHFGLLTKERLQGLTIISPALPIIDMAELVKLQLCIELGDTLAGVPTGPARQEGGAGGVAEEAPITPKGGDEDGEIPQAVPPPPRTQGERIARLEEEVHGVREALQGQREVLDSMARDFSRFSTWTITSLARMMDRAGVPYTR
ncbi:hypothetical protein Tco_0413735 [Tanacetum coccineum]